MTSLAMFPKLATRSRHLHCHIALNCSIGIISQYWVGIFISQSHISKVPKMSRSDGRTDGHPDPTIGPQVYLGPIKRECFEWNRFQSQRSSTRGERRNCLQVHKLEIRDADVSSNLMSMVLISKWKLKHHKISVMMLYYRTAATFSDFEHLCQI